MWCSRAKRRKVNGPPCRGGGPDRTAGGTTTGAARSSCSVPADCTPGSYAVDEPPATPGMMSPVGMPGADESLAQRLLAGDRRALARGISLVENNDPEGWALVKEVYPRT